MEQFRLKYQLKRGVTLIELIVALTLSVLLVTTTSGVIKSMTQKKKSLRIE
jgi:prepilin-type N-terminal cleavage/methylation domain-containing protein